MPWCASCDAYRAPSAVAVDGRCTTCGTPVDPGGLADGTGDSEGLPPVPWHLKLVVASFLVYLAFRGWQGVEWVLDKF
ncbi:MAG TPA: hypothetical protein VM618_05280 [Acidimicrobiia bacterium]|nr:hypothetical protein [Acidimicrobiia bacterium]